MTDKPRTIRVVRPDEPPPPEPPQQTKPVRSAEDAAASREKLQRAADYVGRPRRRRTPAPVESTPAAADLFSDRPKNPLPAAPDAIEQARSVDAALRSEARTIAASMTRFRELIDTAKTGRIHQALGFTSWTAYIADVIGTDMGSLPVDDRRQIVALLAGEGMSQRAIADAVGVSQKTVDRDLDQLSHDDSVDVDLPATVTGLDNKQRPAHPARRKPTPKPDVPKPDVPKQPPKKNPDRGGGAPLDPEFEARVMAEATIRRGVEKELRAEMLAELDQHRAKLDADFATHKAAYDKQNAAVNALRDDERRRYREGIAVSRAKGIISPDEYSVIRSCLHPDSRASVSDEKLAAAFRLFNDSRIKTLLVKET
jgi:hypothetical protein